ncbi:hypothetical protein CLOM_g14257 [Closterium sp. NIES-68]|nr:hypothetical protein CLOM_g14257 [Closterium sp. NIES-68]
MVVVLGWVLLLILQVWCWSARSRHCRSRGQDPAGESRRRTIRCHRCRQFRGRGRSPTRRHRTSGGHDR